LFPEFGLNAEPGATRPVYLAEGPAAARSWPLPSEGLEALERPARRSALIGQQGLLDGEGQDSVGVHGDGRLGGLLPAVADAVDGTQANQRLRQGNGLSRPEALIAGVWLKICPYERPDGARHRQGARHGEPIGL
jgi:hypothetical protein